MNWLKTILENESDEDGKIDISKAMKSIKTEFPKNAVPKETFNQKLDDLKTATELVDELKKDNADVNDLQEKIEEYQGNIETLKTERSEERKSYTLKEKLKEAGAKDVDYMLFKLGEVETDSEGRIIELDNKIKSLIEDNKEMFEVKEEGNEDEKQESKKGFVVQDNKLEEGGTPEKQPETLADAIQSNYEDK